MNESKREISDDEIVEQIFTNPDHADILTALIDENQNCRIFEVRRMRLKEIGKQMGISDERVRQIKENAIKKLKLFRGERMKRILNDLAERE